jgi:hypothetical protein
MEIEERDLALERGKAVPHSPQNKLHARIVNRESSHACIAL